jgi:hypothetical protein
MIFVEGRGKGVCLKIRHTEAEMIGALKQLGKQRGMEVSQAQEAT